VEGLAVALEGTATISGITFDFNVSESNLLNDTVDTVPVFYKGNLSTSVHDATNHFGGQGISFCGLSEVCSVVVTIFTFGAIDLTPTIDITQIQDFSGQIGASQPDPVKLKQIKVDENTVANFDQKLSGNVSEVHINPSGITAGLVGHFASLAVDPDVPPTPGVTLTPAPVPAMPVPNAKDIFVGISDDAINMMFASLTGAGKFKTGAPDGNGCIDTGQTLGSLLPADCDTLVGASNSETVSQRAYCHAIKGDNCGTLTFNDPNLGPVANLVFQNTERGACYGAKGLPAGQTCSSVAAGSLALYDACNITPNFNLRANQPLLFCAKGDVPPRMLFPDTNVAGGSTPAVLRVPSLSVSLVVDRDLDHKQLLPNFGDVHGCFAEGGSFAADCAAYATCLQLNLNFSMSFQTCTDGKPGFVPTFQSVQAKQLGTIGTICGGSTSATGDSNVLDKSSSEQITIPLGQNGAGFAPPICGAGLDLGGFVQCTQAGVFSMKTANPPYPESRDYLAITCKVQ